MVRKQERRQSAYTARQVRYDITLAAMKSLLQESRLIEQMVAATRQYPSSAGGGLLTRRHRKLGHARQHG